MSRKKRLTKTFFNFFEILDLTDVKWQNPMLY